MILKKILGTAIIFFILIPVFSQSQNSWSSVSKSDASTILQTMHQAFATNNNFSIHIIHRSFQNYTDGKPAEESNGFYVKNNKDFHSYLLGIHTIQNNKFRIVIDSVNQAMLVSKPSELVDQPFDKSTVLAILDVCEKIETLKTPTGKLLSITLKSGELKRFVFESDVMGKLKKMVVYYSNLISIDENDPSKKSRPRIEIIFSDFKSPASIDTKYVFDTNNYFTENKNKLKLNKSYANYTIRDLRVDL